MSRVSSIIGDTVKSKLKNTMNKICNPDMFHLVLSYRSKTK